MKGKDKNELKAAKIEELKEKAEELRKQLRQSYLDRETKEVKNRRIAKELRKKLAVALSMLRIKELT